MSPRTLQRRLHAKGVTFKSVVKRTRTELAKEYLAVYLRAVRPRLVGEADTSQLWLGQHGTAINRYTIYDRVRFYAERAGIGHVTPHMIRHTVATEMLRGGADLRHIQKLLGHVKLSTTQIYTRIDIEDLQKVHRSTHPREAKGR